MTRARGELPEPEERLLGIERPSLEDEAESDRKLAEAAELRRLFLVGMMERPMFREWLWSVLDGFGTFQQQFGASPGGFPDPLATQYSMGMKAAGWSLWTTFDDLDPDLASLMRREAAGKAR